MESIVGTVRTVSYRNRVRRQSDADQITGMLAVGGGYMVLGESEVLEMVFVVGDDDDGMGMKIVFN